MKSASRGHHHMFESLAHCGLPFFEAVHCESHDFARRDPLEEFERPPGFRTDPSALPSPKPRQLQLKRIERCHTRRLRPPPRAEQLAASSHEREGFEGLQARVNQPNVRDAFASVNREFRDPVEGIRRGRKHFRHPVGRGLEGGGVGYFGHAGTAPAGKVGDKDIGAEVQLGFIEDDPTARAAGTAVEWVAEYHAQQRGDCGVGTAGAGLSVELSADDLAHHVARQREEIAVGGVARGDTCHDLPPPQALQIDLYHFERLSAHDFVSAMSREQHPVLAFESVCLECLVERVQKPKVRNMRTGVDRELLGAIESTGGGREDFADPVRSECEDALARRRGQSLSAPARDIGNDNVCSEMNLGLVQDPPAAGAAVPELHAGKQCGAERRGAEGVGTGWPRADLQFACDQLPHQVLGQRDDIVVGRGALSRQRHGARVARHGRRLRRLLMLCAPTRGRRAYPTPKFGSEALRD